MRLSADQKNLIEEAAARSGQPVASFTVAALMDAAQRVVDAQCKIRLSSRNWDLFLKLLDDPPEPNERLRRAAWHYEENVVR